MHESGAKKRLINFWQFVKHTESVPSAIQRPTGHLCWNLFLSSFLGQLTPHNSVFISAECGAISVCWTWFRQFSLFFFFFFLLLLIYTQLIAFFLNGVSSVSASQKIQQWTLCSPRNVFMFIILCCEKGESSSDGRITQWLSQELADVRIASKCQRAGAS